MGYFNAIDLTVTQAMQAWTIPGLLLLARAVSWFGEFWVAIISVIITAVILLFFSYRREAIFTLAVLTAPTLNYFLKLIINRPRPNSELIKVFTSLTDSGFPSGHVSYYVVFFGFLIFLALKHKSWPSFLRLILLVISIALIILISFSRIYLGAHWLSDILGGYIFGAIILSALIYFYKQ